MLIITADDLGRDRAATDACMDCFRRKRITSASLMVFMQDSKRAADLAVREGLETGLHLNLISLYDAPGVAESVRRGQASAARFFLRGPWTQVVYNPFIARAIAMSFQSQLEEYRRLCGTEPAHFNGHKHFHLSPHIILGRLLPPGAAVRRSFTFNAGEKGLVNRCYRRLVDAWLLRRHISTDAFFSLQPIGDLPRLARIVDLAQTASVEIMVHPWKPDEFAFLAEDRFQVLTAPARWGGFGALRSGAKGQP
jgi:predicted glycoside hydrolase/deacetylase ChbG (UPF0249 family)